MYKKKLIEVALPLESINKESAREKTIRHGHPSTLHLWWARRPLATAKAIIWASLVDDPSNRLEEFPTEEMQDLERERLFKILEELIIWENSDNEHVLQKAKEEIIKSTDGKLPEFLDPFSGGGSLPLEAQRLGLKVHAHDLNPVALTINKCMVEIPPNFSGKRPINPKAQALWPLEKSQSFNSSFPGTSGLEDDVRYYGELLKKRVQDKLHSIFPLVDLPQDLGGGKATAIAWIWSRSLRCSNPACGYLTPLVNSFQLSKKKGNEAFIHPIEIPKEKRFDFSISDQKSEYPDPKIGKGKFKCIHCGEPMDPNYIRSEFQKEKVESQLMAIVAEEPSRRLYLSPDQFQIEKATTISKPEIFPVGVLNGKCRISLPLYGFNDFSDMFTNRQLVMLTTFSETLKEMLPEMEEEAIRCGYQDNSLGLEQGGDGAKAYAEAIVVYLSLLIDKLADYHSSFCSWNSSRQLIRNVFGRQAIPMVWDYAEGNPFCHSSGSFDNMLNWILKAIHEFPQNPIKGQVEQHDAREKINFKDLLISTDPPYYDNIEYADLSDYFYVWLRWNLKSIYPSLFETIQVPKKEELVATPYRHKTLKEAKEFFENGMLRACQQIYNSASNDYPVTIYYAYKQSETETKNGKSVTASSGWETMLTSIIEAGFSITGTWPVRTELGNRMIGNDKNALASSIVLVCRKRSKTAPNITRRKFILELRSKLKEALPKLQQSNIAPVDMTQSAIGPGMSIYSQYSSVLESNGEPMSVRTALALINQEIDLYFNEQDSNLQPEDRFCIELYSQSAFNDIKYGEAEVLSTAKNSSIDKMVKNGLLFAEKGIVHLLSKEEIKINSKNDISLWLLTQFITRELEEGGVNKASEAVRQYGYGRENSIKSLAYRLFSIAEKKKWGKEAAAYNNLIEAWPEIQNRLAEQQYSEVSPLFE